MLIKNLFSKKMMRGILHRQGPSTQSLPQFCCFSTKAVDIRLQQMQSIQAKAHSSLTDFKVAPPSNKINSLVNQLLEVEMNQFEQFIEDMCTQFIVIIRSKGFTLAKLGNFLDTCTKKLDSTFLKKKQTELELLHFMSTLKFLMLNNLQNLQWLKYGYNHLELYLKTKTDAINRFAKKVCHQQIQKKTIPTMVRLISLIGNASKQVQSNYLKMISPYIQYFKAPQMLMLFYESWKYSYELPYDLISAIYDNPVYLKLSDITQSYYKMLFVEKEKGRISPDCQGIYLSMFVQISQKETVLNMLEFRKFIKIVKSEIFYIQVEQIRQNIEANLNELVRMAKGQEHTSGTITLTDLIDIHMGFAEKSCSGEILFQKIIQFSKDSPTITPGNLNYFQLFLKSVFRNAKRQLKYEIVDYLNKEYSTLTLKVLDIYVKKMETLWPQIIFQINEIAEQINVKSPLLKDIQRIFKTLQANNALSLKTNEAYTKKVIDFYINFKQKITIKKDTIFNLLSQISNMSYPLPDDYYSILNKLITLSAIEDKESSLKLLPAIASKLIEPALVQLLSQPAPFINHMDRSKMDLVLVAAHLTKNEMFISLETGQRIIKEKLIYMVNSYEYQQIYDILAFCFKLKSDDPAIFESLYSNLSTFVIYINESSAYYLNERYAKLYPLLIKLTLSHRQFLAQFKNKSCFNILQHMFVKFKDSFSSQDAMNFIILLNRKQYLIPQLQDYISEIEFQTKILESANRWSLEEFAEINDSIKEHIESSSSKYQIEVLLERSNLDLTSIRNIFINKESYKKLIMNKNLNPSFQIPDPGSDDINLQMMYICSKIYQKVSQIVSLGVENQSYSKVGLELEIDYIRRHKIVKINPLNEFMLESRVLPSYNKVEVWKNYEFALKSLALPKEFKLDTDVKLDTILIQVVQAILGSNQKILEVCSQFPLNKGFKQRLAMLDLNVKYNGSLIEVFSPDQSVNETNLCIIYTTNPSHKILYLMGYLLKTIGEDVIIIHSNDDLSALEAKLKKTYSKKVSSSKAHIKIESKGEQQ